LKSHSKLLDFRRVRSGPKETLIRGKVNLGTTGLGLKVQQKRKAGERTRISNYASKDRVKEGIMGGGGGRC